MSGHSWGQKGARGRGKAPGEAELANGRGEDPGLLPAGWRVMVPLNCGVCPPPHPVFELDQCLVEASWLGGLEPVVWRIELDLVSLKGGAISSSVFWDVCASRLYIVTLLI